MVQLGAPACQQIQLPKGQVLQRGHNYLVTPMLAALLLTLWVIFH